MAEKWMPKARRVCLRVSAKWVVKYSEKRFRCYELVRGKGNLRGYQGNVWCGLAEHMDCILMGPSFE